MKKSVLGLTLIVVFSVILSSCGHYPHPDEVFSRFSDKYLLPVGKVYRTSAGEMEADHLSKDLFSALYARPDGTDDFEDIESCVLWQGVSICYVYEMGIFLCHDGDSAKSVFTMCENRLALIRSLRSYTNTAAADTAVLRLSGRMVVYMVLPDNALAEKCMNRVL